MDGVAAAVIGVVSSVFAAGVAWGLLSQRVNTLEKEIERYVLETKERSNDFVTQTHFSAVIDPLKRAIEIMQKDVKEILKAVKP